MSGLWPWFTLFFLGAYHGINPAMGWLFAVALGMQEKSRRAVLAALPPIALGHAISIAVVIALLLFAQASIPARALRIATAAFLFGFGLLKILRPRHPRWVGMRLGFRDLTLWSLLMASAHGAGLMLMPVLLAWPEDASGGHAASMGTAGAMVDAGPMSAPQGSFFAIALRGLAVVGVHTAGHFITAALIALLVYEKLGLALLQRAWFNLDLLWALVLMISGALIVVI